MITRKTREKFIEYSIKTHGDKYDYSLVDYKNTNTNVKIICKTHGEFTQRPSNHINGVGCRKCANKNLSINKLSNSEEFIKKSKITHGDIYDYSLIEYTNAKSKVKIICSIHGVFEQIANSHVLGLGCAECGYIKSGISKTKNLIDFKYKNVIQPKKYKLIALDKGYFAKVDNEDFEELYKYNWCLDSNGYSFNRKLGRMHRYIIKTPINMYTDHINHDRLDNRKSNLRICTIQENNWNMGFKNNTTSKYKGVSWCKITKKWFSYITFNGNRLNLGYHTCEISAAKAYDEKAKELFAEFSYLNFRND